MITIRKSADRGQASHGWLESRHTFSFADYHDPKHMGFGPLRVINEDRVAPAKGFAAHSHRDMEIVSYVLDGALEHSDSMGNGSVIRPGDVQLMRAGTGVTHSEYNESKDTPVHFLQIWILPDRAGLEPAYAQQHFPVEQRLNTLRLVASMDGRESSLPIHQNISMYATVLEAGKSVSHALAAGREAWVQMASGSARINRVDVEAGDGASVRDERALEIVAESPSEILLFDFA
jgi:redox-sensitive bicupin YhaK (pirin superfamily)